MIKVSIIIPVFNSEEYLERCINSLINQTLKDIEFIFVDDGSSDSSAEIIKKYAATFPNKVIYHYQNNSGQGAARNTGLDISKGKYIGYVDSDDYVELNMFELMYDKAVKTDSDIVICGSYNVSEDEKKIQVDIVRKLDESDKTNAFLGKMAVWNKLYKKEVISDIRFRSKVWYEDVDFTLRVLERVKKISFLDLPLYHYVVRQGSTMNNNNYKRNVEIIDAFEVIRRSNNFYKYKEIYEFLVIDHVYISASVRVIKASPSKDERDSIIALFKSYLEEFFPDYKENSFICNLPLRRKIIYNLLNMRAYTLIKILIKSKNICN